MNKNKYNIEVSMQTSDVDVERLREWHRVVWKLPNHRARVESVHVSIDKPGAAGPGGDMGFWRFNVVDGALKQPPLSNQDTPADVRTAAREALDEHLEANPVHRPIAFQEHEVDIEQ